MDLMVDIHKKMALINFDIYRLAMLVQPILDFAATSLRKTKHAKFSKPVTFVFYIQNETFSSCFSIMPHAY